MMHRIKFREFAKLPENYPPSGLTPEQSNEEFDRKRQDPNVITDEDGPPGFREQVGIQTKKLFINREAMIKEQGYDFQDT